MPWALIGLVLMPLGLEALALYLMGWGIELVLAIAETVAGLPRAVVVVASMPRSSLIAFTLGGLWLCLWRPSWRLFGLGGFAIGLVATWAHQSPDILISGDARVAAIRLEDNSLSFSDRRIGRFDREQWMRALGTGDVSFWPETGAALSGRLRCDALGCLYRREGELVAFVMDGRALADDCRAATLVISREPLRSLNCPMPSRVIDRFDLWREGAHAIRLGDDGIIVESVRAARGRRPWVSWR